MTDLGSYVEKWAPPTRTDTYQVGAWPLAAFADLLDQPAPDLTPGEPIPPQWHVFLSPEHAPTRELGVDGHVREGRFLPPIPQRRRMFAGGRVRFRSPLRVGDVVTRQAELAAVQHKQGRSGELLFVTVRTTHSVGDDVRVVEEEDLVYRSGPSGSTTKPFPAAEKTDEPWQLSMDTTAAALFRFSALTYNAHRIHYDLPYVTEVEGHAGLLVHGPLLALLLLELPRRFVPDRTVTAFDYRLLRPAIAGTPIVATGSPDGVAAGSLGAAPSITGRIGFGR
jgi:3-methylfumaryl-CoA hydratase